MWSCECKEGQDVIFAAVVADECEGWRKVQKGGQLIYCNCVLEGGARQYQS